MAHSGINVLLEGSNFSRLMGGLWVSVWIAVVSLFFGLIVGTAFGVLRTTKSRVLRFILRLYLEIFRIIPTVVLLFLVYYILPRQLHINMPADWMAVLAFSLWVAAEFSDIVRGAIQSVPQHQRESGLAIGLTRFQLFRYILLPQAMKLEVPAAINLATRVVKTTSPVDDHQHHGRHQRRSTDHRSQQFNLPNRGVLGLRVNLFLVLHRRLPVVAVGKKANRPAVRRSV